jgi:hypothetical protein
MEDIPSDQLDESVMRSLAASSLGPLTQRIEGSVQTLVDHPNLHKLTNFARWDDPRRYARLVYLQRFKDAVGDADEKGGFIFPDMEDGLLTPDMEMRDSVKQGTRKIIESMSKIFERSDGGGRGFGLLGRRR